VILAVLGEGEDAALSGIGFPIIERRQRRGGAAKAGMRGDIFDPLVADVSDASVSKPFEEIAARLQHGITPSAL
jgi:hypothetical protein